MADLFLVFFLRYLILFSFPGAFPGGSERKVSAGDLGSIPGSRSYLGEGNGNPLQYSCLENSMDRGAWQATVSSWDHKELDMTE